MEVITWALGIAFAMSLAFNAWIASAIVSMKQQLATLTAVHIERGEEIKTLRKVLEGQDSIIRDIEILLARNNIANDTRHN